MATDVALLDLAIEAHGGSERWDSTEAVVVQVSAGGFAFRSKFQRAATFEGRISTSGQQVALRPWKARGQQGVLDAGAVRIESDDGQVLAERADRGRPCERCGGMCGGTSSTCSTSRVDRRSPRG